MNNNDIMISDIQEMHNKYRVNESVKNMDKEKLLKFLDFRISFLQEELDEMKEAAARMQTIKDADDIVDALIDLLVVALGTLDAYEIDTIKAWKEVYKANMNKEIGIKESRPNPLGLPDLIKPAGWTSPSHEDNVGLLIDLIV